MSPVNHLTNESIYVHLKRNYIEIYLENVVGINNNLDEIYEAVILSRTSDSFVKTQQRVDV